jgi:hypothetical protein
MVVICSIRANAAVTSECFAIPSGDSSSAGEARYQQQVSGSITRTTSIMTHEQVDENYNGGHSHYWVHDISMMDPSCE